MEILLNGKENLEELFAEIDRNRYVEALKSKLNASKILPGFREMIKEKALPDKVSRMMTTGHMAA